MADFKNNNGNNGNEKHINAGQYNYCIFEDCDQESHPMSPYCFGHMEAEIAEAETQRKLAAGAWFEGVRLVKCAPIRVSYVKEENPSEIPSAPPFDPFATYFGPAFRSHLSATAKPPSECEHCEAEKPEHCFFHRVPAPLYDENRSGAGEGEL